MTSETPLPLRTNLRQLWPNLRLVFSVAWGAARWELIAYIGTYVIGAVVPVLLSYSLSLLIDGIGPLAGSQPASLPMVILVLLGARAVIYGVNYIVYWTIGMTLVERQFWYKVVNTLTITYDTKVSGLDLAHLENSEVQNMILKAKDNLPWRVTSQVDYVFRGINSIITMIAAAVVLVPFGWWIPLAVIASNIPRLAVRVHYGELQWSVYNGNTPTSRLLWYLRWLLTDVDPIREGRIMGSAPLLLKRTERMQRELAGDQLRVIRRATFSQVLPALLETGVLLGVAVAVLPPVLAGAMTVGAFTLLISLSEQLGGAVGGTVMNLASLLESNLYISHIREVLQLPKLLPDPVHPVVLPDSTHPKRIEFRGVTFSYPNSEPVLHDLSFVIEPGQRVAIVGANGAGKSTLIKLLCRFYDVSSGSIRVGGHDLRELDQSSWHRQLATLFQEFERYHFTVRENITLGGNGIEDEARMREAAKMSGADVFIERLPQKYDQALGREYDGEELSTGQWQKLAVARAIYRASPILILDEPTSAIDAIAEEEIFNNLERHSKGRTLVLVSHRFSTVRNADRILVLEHGRITEDGTHAQLLARGGTYARMFHTQAKGYVE